MCCSYFLENSTKLAGIAHAASKHRIKGRMLEKLGQPLITEGEILPGKTLHVVKAVCFRWYGDLPERHPSSLALKLRPSKRAICSAKLLCVTDASFPLPGTLNGSI